MTSFFKYAPGPFGAASAIFSGRQAIKDYTATDPFKQKKAPVTDVFKGHPMKGTKSTKSNSTKANPSQSAAQKRYNLIAQSGGTMYRSRPKRKRSSVKQSYAKRRRTSSKKRPISRMKKYGTSKSRKPVSRKALSYSVKRKYEDYGDYTRSIAAWVGFQNHASQIRLWDAVGEALTRAMLATVKTYPKSYDENITSQITTVNGPARNLYIRYRRILEIGGGDQFLTATAIDLTSLSTFKALSDAVGAQIQDYANSHSVAVAPNADSVGYYPYEFYFAGSGTQGGDGTANRELGGTMLDIHIKQKVQLRNITLNDAGGTSVDVIDTNPIKGRVYSFKADAPVIRDSILESATYDYSGIQNKSPAKGVQSGPVIATQVEPLATTLAAKEIFENCSGVRDVYISAGKASTFSTEWKFKGSLKTFCDRAFFSGYHRGTFGGSTWVGLVPANKSNFNDIKVNVTRTCHVMSRASLRTKKILSTHYEGEPLAL